MVTVIRSDLERKLTTITSALTSNSSYPLLGANAQGQLSFWQDSYMPIWDGVQTEGDDEFTFSVDPSVFRTIVSGFKSVIIDIQVNTKGAVVITSGKSKVVVPYCDGPYDEIPESPKMEVSCTVGRDFLRALSKSKDFVAKTYENMGLTYCYLGNEDGKFFISGAGSIYQYANKIPFSGETLSEIVMPPSYASVVSRLFSNTDIQIGLSNQQQLIMSDGPTLISTRISNEKYPSTIHTLAETEGELLFTANKSRLLETFRLANQTTKEDMVGISGTTEGLDIYIPKAVIEAELVIEDVEIVKEFTRTYFSLPFLIKCISAFEEETINVEILSQCNGAFRIGTGTEEFTVLQSIQYDEP